MSLAFFGVLNLYCFGFLKMEDELLLHKEQLFLM